MGWIFFLLRCDNSMHPAYVKRLLLEDKGAEWYLPFTFSVGITNLCAKRERHASPLVWIKRHSRAWEIWYNKHAGKGALP